MKSFDLKQFDGAWAKIDLTPKLSSRASEPDGYTTRSDRDSDPRATKFGLPDGSHYCRYCTEALNDAGAVKHMDDVDLFYWTVWKCNGTSFSCSLKPGAV